MAQCVASTIPLVADSRHGGEEWSLCNTSLPLALHSRAITKSYGFCPYFFLKKIFKYLFGYGNGTPLQYSCLENPMDGGAWKAAVHGVAEGPTGLSDFIFTFHFHAL